jgi:hypothetical protein
MNYTQPDNPEHQDRYTDLLGSTLVSARALGLLLKEGEGILVEPKGKVEDLLEPNCGLLVVANLSDQVKVFYLKDYVEDLSEFKEGMIISVGE